MSQLLPILRGLQPTPSPSSPCSHSRVCPLSPLPQLAVYPQNKAWCHKNQGVYIFISGL